MAEVVATLLDQSARKFELLGFDERPEPRPPIDSELLAHLEAWWEDRTFERLPAEYREFLLICDGIDNFSVSYSIFGARDLLSHWYSDLSRQVIEGGVSFDFEPERPPVLIGYDAETRTRAFFELSHERAVATEPPLIEGDPGNMSLHPSFGAFLEMSVQANRDTIAELKRTLAERNSQ